MSEYVYASDGGLMMNLDGEISLPRKRIVRCRDCKYYCPERISCKWFMAAVKLDGFCAWGERRKSAIDNLNANM